MLLFLLLLNLAVLNKTALAQCGQDWDASCSKELHVLNMTQNDLIFLHAHNSKRDLLAGGQLEGLKPAARMLTLKWDQQLADKAIENVKQCRAQADKCHVTEAFPQAAQNVKLVHGTLKIPYQEFSQIMMDWWDQHKLLAMDIIEKYPDLTETPYSNFALMAKDKSTHIGCAAVIFKDDKLWNFLLTCNYALGNAVDESTYEVGESATGCKTGRHYMYTNLCSDDE